MKFPEAEPDLIERYCGMKERKQQILLAAQPRLAEAIRRLVDLYTAWDKPDEAAKWRKRLDSVNGPDQPKDEPTVMP